MLKNTLLWLFHEVATLPTEKTKNSLEFHDFLMANDDKALVK